MKITIEQSAFLKTLGCVQNVVERRNTVPILANVRLTAHGGLLRLQTTDMDVAVSAGVEATIEQEGDTTAPVHMLHDIVKKLPDGAQVSIETLVNDGENDGERLVIRSGRSRFELVCLPSADFPVMDSTVDDGTSFDIPTEDLKHLIDHARFAISTEETRYYLNGIYLHTHSREEDALLRVAATDGHRLACVEVPLPTGAEHLSGVIIPRKTVNELRKMVDDYTDDVMAVISANRCRFSFGEITLTSKLIEGTFPDYGKVIPKDNERILDMERSAFVEAVERVSIIASEKSRVVKLDIRPGAVELSAYNTDSGHAREEVEASFEGEGFSMGFNASYLSEIVRHVQGDNIRLRLKDSSSAALISLPDYDGTLYVLMPMRV